MKKALSLLLVSVFALGLVACGSSGNSGNSDTTVPDLVGEWEQSNKNSETSYQVATISDNSIEVYWVSEEDDSKSLYWAGTFVTPTEPGSYSWDSANDTEKTGSALLASSDATKTFTYENGKISYSVSAMGTTTTVELEKVK